MKYRYFFILAALTGMFIDISSAGQGIQLFTKSDFIPLASEASLLTTAENAHLSAMRKSSSLYKSVQIVKINRRALGGNIATIALPDGAEYTYRGTTTKTEGDKFSLWRGASERGTLVISYDENTIGGEIRENGHVYGIATLAGERVEILTEAASLTDAEELPSMSGKVDPERFRHPIRPLPSQPASSAIGGKP
ncbi:hypothetical protein [Roseateles sp.]|uniref:hypothetical protein n=1 Tax=Roseateles sp. TaxID=1971397 RepID=UPI003BAB2D5B